MSEKILQLNEGLIKGRLRELVRGSVEETLNELLEAEAEKLTQAARYERNEQRQGYRSGHCNRNLTTTSGDVTLKVPKLKGNSFETAIIERYRRRESSVEEALIEMYLAGVSVRRVEDITETLWGSKVSPSTISELNKKAYVHIEDWRKRPLQSGRYPYVYVDGIYLRRNWGGEFENVAILVAIAVNEDGYREVLGAAEGKPRMGQNLGHPRVHKMGTGQKVAESKRKPLLSGWEAVVLWLREEDLNLRPPGYELRPDTQAAAPQCFPGLFRPEIPKNPKVVPVRSTAAFDILGHILGQDFEGRDHQKLHRSKEYSRLSWKGVKRLGSSARAMSERAKRCRL
jgi:hypothetical protein